MRIKGAQKKETLTVFHFSFLRFLLFQQFLLLFPTIIKHNCLLTSKHAHDQPYNHGRFTRLLCLLIRIHFFFLVVFFWACCEQKTTNAEITRFVLFLFLFNHEWIRARQRKRQMTNKNAITTTIIAVL